MRKDLQGLYEYYVPDGTYNALEYKNGKWILKDNVTANNANQRTKVKNKPKMGNVCFTKVFFDLPYFNSINANAEPTRSSQKRENGKKKFNSEFLPSIKSAN